MREYVYVCVCVCVEKGGGGGEAGGQADRQICL